MKRAASLASQCKLITQSVPRIIHTPRNHRLTQNVCKLLPLPLTRLCTRTEEKHIRKRQPSHTQYTLQQIKKLTPSTSTRKPPLIHSFKLNSSIVPNSHVPTHRLPVTPKSPPTTCECSVGWVLQQAKLVCVRGCVVPRKLV